MPDDDLAPQTPADLSWYDLQRWSRLNPYPDAWAKMPPYFRDNDQGQLRLRLTRLLNEYITPSSGAYPRLDAVIRSILLLIDDSNELGPYYEKLSVLHSDLQHEPPSELNLLLCGELTWILFRAEKFLAKDEEARSRLGRYGVNALIDASAQVRRLPESQERNWTLFNILQCIQDPRQSGLALAALKEAIQVSLQLAENEESAYPLALDVMNTYRLFAAPHDPFVAELPVPEVVRRTMLTIMDSSNVERYERSLAALIWWAIARARHADWADHSLTEEIDNTEQLIRQAFSPATQWANTELSKVSSDTRGQPGETKLPADEDDPAPVGSLLGHIDKFLDLLASLGHWERINRIISDLELRVIDRFSQLEVHDQGNAIVIRRRDRAKGFDDKYGWLGELARACSSYVREHKKPGPSL